MARSTKCTSVSDPGWSSVTVTPEAMKERIKAFCRWSGKGPLFVDRFLRGIMQKKNKEGQAIFQYFTDFVRTKSGRDGRITISFKDGIPYLQTANDIIGFLADINYTRPQRKRPRPSKKKAVEEAQQSLPFSKDVDSPVEVKLNGPILELGGSVPVQQALELRNGKFVTAVKCDNGDMFVDVKSVCAALDVDSGKQENLLNGTTAWTHGYMNVRHEALNVVQAKHVIKREDLTAWLYSISPTSVRTLSWRPLLSTLRVSLAADIRTYLTPKNVEKPAPSADELKVAATKHLVTSVYALCDTIGKLNASVARNNMLLGKIVRERAATPTEDIVVEGPTPPIVAPSTATPPTTTSAGLRAGYHTAAEVYNELRRKCFVTLAKAERSVVGKRTLPNFVVSDVWRLIKLGGSTPFSGMFYFDEGVKELCISRAAIPVLEERLRYWCATLFMCKMKWDGSRVCSRSRKMVATAMKVNVADLSDLLLQAGVPFPHHNEIEMRISNIPQTPAAFKGK